MSSSGCGSKVVLSFVFYLFVFSIFLCCVLFCVCYSMVIALNLLVKSGWLDWIG